MKGQRCKQTLLVVGISVAVFMYLVLAANYAPMIFMSFSKKVQPLQYAHLHPNSDASSHYYQEIESQKPPPKAVILWTTWRSGSTYLGELLANAVQDTFYSTEPLHYWRVKVLHENNTETSLARAFLQELLHCRVSRNFQKQIDYMSRQDFYMRWNTFFSRRCRPMRLCGKRKFVNHMCRRAHIHIVKVLRLSLKWAWSILQDNGLDLKIIYVARDPRAVLVVAVHFAVHKMASSDEEVIVTFVGAIVASRGRKRKRYWIHPYLKDNVETHSIYVVAKQLELDEEKFQLFY